METLTNGATVLDEDGSDGPAAYREAINANARTITGDGLLQAGIVGSDWEAGSATVDPGTASFSWPSIGGTAWLPGPVSGLVRTSTVVGALGPLAPPAKPVSGKFMKVCLMIAASGSSAVASLACGTEKTTEAEAILSTVATPTGHICVREEILKNVGGVYSRTTFARDRRPWATGANAFVTPTSTSGEYTTESFSIAAISSELAVRLECSGRPVEFDFTFYGGSTGAPLVIYPWIDGALPTSHYAEGKMPATAGENIYFSYRQILTVNAGSHLFQPAWDTGVGGKANILKAAFFAPVFSVKELKPNANNGTS